MIRKQNWRKGLNTDILEEKEQQTEEIRPWPLRQAMWIILLLFAAFLLVWPKNPNDLFDETRWVSLHTMLEFLAIVVSFMIFGIGWHSWSKDQPGNLTLIASAFLAVGLFDFAHVMSYPGMPDLATASNTQKAIYFWLAARLLAGVTLLCAVLLPWRPFASPSIRYVCLAGSLGLVALVYWVGWFYEDLIPHTFIPEQGLTPFKIGTEYLIMAFYAVTAIILLVRSHKPQPFDVKHLFVSAVVMIMGEVCFTRYVAVNDMYNFLGHVFKIIAYYFLYRAVFVANVRAPFLRLHQSERLLKKREEWLFTILTSIGDAVIVTDARGRILFMNPVAERVTGWTLEEAAGKEIQAVFRIVDDTTREEMESPVAKALREGQIAVLAHHAVLIAKDGSEIPIEDSAAPIRNEQGSIQGVVLVFRDVTERKRAEEQLKSVKEQLESFVHHNADAIVMYDLEGHVLQINEAYEKIFGWTAQEVVGQRLPCVPPDLFREMENILAEIRRGGRMIGFETVRQRKDGRLLNVNVTYSPVRDAEGNVIAISGIARDVTEQKQREKEKERLLAILEKTSDFVAVTDVGGRVLYANRATRNLLGLEAEENPNLTIPDIYPEWAGRLVQNEGLPTAAREGMWSGETALMSHDGKEIPVHQVILAHHGPNGKVEYYSTIARDLTDFKRSQEKERLAAKVFERISEGIVITDANGNIISVNPAFTKITGYSDEEVISKNPSILSSGRHSPEFYQKMWTSLLETGHWTGEIWDKRKNGEIYLEEISISAVKDESGKTTHYVGVFRDITLRKQLEEKMQFQAYHDALTSLPNRTLFLERLTKSIAYARQNQQMLAVMFLDLDRFKYINDTLGHNLGDLFLQEVAERLKRCVRTSDTVSRLGGDEFVILLSHLSVREDAAEVAEKILEALSQPFMLNGQEYTISASIGISLYPVDGEDEEALIRNADMAMYHAKEQGNRYQFFLPSMGVQSLERLKLENDLRKALEREEFLLHYQPKVDLNTGEIVGAEVLVRWQHPELGMVSPEKFIPLAEETGLILPLGEWVLRTALRQNKAWQDEGLAPIRVAVNLSMTQFKLKNIKETISRILQETGFASHFLELELTEGVMMSNPETTIRILQELKEIGIQISLDDFGTGYSSLSYLKQLPLDIIKIDRSFIQNINTNSDDRTVVKAMIDLAHSMKMKVIAEGVENEEQIRVLRACQCDEIQGYFCSPPVSAEEFKVMLQKKRVFLAG